MIIHTIITGSNDQVTKSKTLKAIMDHSQGVALVNWFGDQPLETLFNPINFAVTTETVLVFTNNKNFDFVDFYIFHATNPLYLNKNIDFIFVSNKNPFEQTTAISKRFRVVEISKMDNELETYSFNKLSLYQLDSKMEHLLQMCDDLHTAKNFLPKEKQDLMQIYKTMIKQTKDKRERLQNTTTKEILSSLNVKA